MRAVLPGDCHVCGLRMPKTARKPRGGIGRAKKSTTPMKEADRLARLIVLARGSCARCGTQNYLQWAHVFKRSYHATRWLEDGAFPLCRGCHKWETDRPIEGERFWRGLLGDGRYEELRVIAVSHPKTDYKALLSSLRARAKELDVA